MVDGWALLASTLLALALLRSNLPNDHLLQLTQLQARTQRKTTLSDVHEDAKVICIDACGLTARLPACCRSSLVAPPTLPTLPLEIQVAILNCAVKISDIKSYLTPRATRAAQSVGVLQGLKGLGCECFGLSSAEPTSLTAALISRPSQAEAQSLLFEEIDVPLVKRIRTTHRNRTTSRSSSTTSSPWRDLGETSPDAPPNRPLRRRRPLSPNRIHLLVKKVPVPNLERLGELCWRQSEAHKHRRQPVIDRVSSTSRQRSHPSSSTTTSLRPGSTCRGSRRCILLSGPGVLSTSSWSSRRFRPTWRNSLYTTLRGQTTQTSTASPPSSDGTTA